MIKVICIKPRKNEKVGDIFYLQANTIFGDCDGDWYGTFYKMDENENFIEIGNRLLSRFQSISIKK